MRAFERQTFWTHAVNYICIDIRTSKNKSGSVHHSSFAVPYQTLWQYSDGTLLTGVECSCGIIGKNRYSRPISGFGIDHCSSVVNFRRCSIGYSTYESPISRVQQTPPRHTPKTTEQNLIVRTGKTEAEVINNKRLRSRYCTVEAN